MEQDRIRQARAKPKRASRHRFRNYGLAQEEFELLLFIQNRSCAICFTPFDGFSKGPPHVDHDHALKTVRGLLCRNCNTVEGLVRTSGIPPLDYGVALQEYLDNPPYENIK